MPTIYYFPAGVNSPAIVSYLSGYLHTEVHIRSLWFVPGTLNLED